MKAAVIEKFGQNPKIAVRCIDKPHVQGNTLLVRVHACSLNPIDYKIKFGKFRWLIAFKKHKITASDFCGQIVAVGSKVRGYRVDQFVYGMINPLKTGT